MLLSSDGNPALNGLSYFLRTIKGLTDVKSI